MQVLIFEFVRADDAADPYAFAHGTQHYLIRAEGGTYVESTLRWNAALLADLEAVSSNPDAAQRIGQHLADFLRPAGWAHHAAEIEAAAIEGRRFDIVVRAAAAELFSLPWGVLLMPGTGRRLQAVPGCLVRLAWPGTTATPRSAETNAQRLLFAWSAAGGAVPAAAMNRTFDTLDGFDATRDMLAHASLATLQAALCEDIAVLHVLAHGTPAGDGFGVRLDDDVVDAARLSAALTPWAGTLRLVVLTVCDSARGGSIAAHLGGLARALHRAGVEAVVGASAPLAVPAAIALSAAMYPALFNHDATVETAFEAGVRAAGCFDLVLWARAADRPLRPICRRPYRGLLAFEARHRRFFYGREAEQTEILSDLAALQAAGRPRFLVVAGASGTGKSSLVRAGALPTVLGGYREQGDGPIREAIAALERVPSGSDAVRKSKALLSAELQRARGGGWRGVVMRPGGSPTDALDDALQLPGTGPLCLVVDQFEELFTHVEDMAERQRFVQRLWNLARAQNGDVHVIITIRIDFVGRCGELVVDEAGLRLDRVAYDEAHRVFVAQMSPVQLRAAIEQPAERVGLRFEAGLVDRILADVAQAPGALPLLSYALDQLWSARDGLLMTQAAYVQMGGAAGALHRRADTIHAGFTPPQQAAARALLVRLVTVSANTHADTRRRIPIAQMQTASTPVFEHVLTTLVNARLLVRSEVDGKPVVEVAHEALIRQWPTLAGWLEVDRERLIAVAEVDSWIPAWRTHGTLLDGNALGYAASVRDRYPGALSPDAMALIEASEAAVSRVRRRRRRQMRASIAAAVVMGVLGILALVSWRSASTARAGAEQARARAERARNMALVAENAQAEATRVAKRQRDQARWAGLVAGARQLKEKDETTAGLLLAELPADRPGNLPPKTFKLVREMVGVRPPTRVFAQRVKKAAWTANGNLLVQTPTQLDLVDVQGRVVRADLQCQGKSVRNFWKHPTRDIWLTDGKKRCLWRGLESEPQSLPLAEAVHEVDWAAVDRFRIRADGKAFSYDLATGRQLREIRVSRLVYRLFWLNDEWLISESSRNRLKLRNAHDFQEYPVDSCGKPVQYLADGTLIGEANDTLYACRFEVDAMGTKARMRPIARRKGIRSFHRWADGRTAALVNDSGSTLHRSWELHVCAATQTLFEVGTAHACRPQSWWLPNDGELTYLGDLMAMNASDDLTIVSLGQAPETDVSIRFRGAPHFMRTASTSARHIALQSSDHDYQQIHGVGGFTLPHTWHKTAFSPDGQSLLAHGPNDRLGIWRGLAQSPIRIPFPTLQDVECAHDACLLRGDRWVEQWTLGGVLQTRWDDVFVAELASGLMVQRLQNTLRFLHVDGHPVRPDLEWPGAVEAVRFSKRWFAVGNSQGSRVIPLDRMGGQGVDVASEQLTLQGEFVLIPPVQSGAPERFVAPTATGTAQYVLDCESIRSAGPDAVWCFRDEKADYRALSTGAVHHRLDLPGGAVDFQPLPDTGLLAAVGDAIARVFSPASGWQTFMAATAGPVFETVTMSRDGLWVLAVDAEGRCSVWAWQNPDRPVLTRRCDAWRTKELLERIEPPEDVNAAEYFDMLLALAGSFQTHELDAVDSDLRWGVTQKYDMLEIHQLQWHDLNRHLRNRTEICLTVDQRMMWLGEDEAQAQDASRRCQARTRP